MYGKGHGWWVWAACWGNTLSGLVVAVLAPSPRRPGTRRCSGRWGPALCACETPQPATEIVGTLSMCVRQARHSCFACAP
ncbi:hypothetical protein V8C86DRAFT_2467230 [Haematococcus lacustris]